ncbi:MAG TPA: glycosyltransferase family 2 protein [Mycobacteriales bacterium]|nr:glycosyltransferase family 2 protein [Mycobacteriales bacterium]
MSERVVAVVVTYERLELLRDSLAAVTGQTRRPDAVVVVDNASGDGTAEAVAAEHPEVELVRLSRNTGGAGGFTVGLERALALGADVVWLMDDDTVPSPAALEALLATRSAGPAQPALVASRVVWEDGRDHPMNTPRPYPLTGLAQRRAAAAAGCVPVRSASFVSVLVDAAAVRAVGLPLADYFLWNDDFEFTTRLLRGRRGLWCPASVVVHRTKKFGSTDADPGPRFYFEVRNKVWLFTRSSGLNPLERLLYLLSTLLRWGRTVRGSSDRLQLVRAAVRGGRDALRAGPRPNDVVLAAALAEERAS